MSRRLGWICVSPGASLLGLIGWMALSGGILASGCGGKVEEGGFQAEALLGGSSMEDTPWPSDVFLGGGRLHVSGIPLDGARGPLDSLARALSEMDGAPIYGSVFFPVRGALQDGPAEGTATWIDLDAPDRRFESGLWIRTETGELVALAPRGEVLTAGHRFGVVVDTPAIGPSAEMRDALDGRGPYSALYAALPPRFRGKRVSAATVFTVGHPTGMVEKMVEVAASLPTPVARVTKVLRGSALEEFTGSPSTTRPGLGDPKGILHDAIGTIILGEFDATSFLSANPPQFGLVELDTQGRPLVKGREAVPFLLTVPKQATAETSIPLVIFQHGLNAGRSQVLSVANSFAKAGYATIGVDALWHGNRAPAFQDEIHNFSGVSGADGLADPNDFGASAYLFNFSGDAARGVEAFDGRYVADNFRQAITDLVEFARMITHGGLSAVAAADPSLGGLTFDTSRVVYTSESFGSVLGGSVVAVSPDLVGAVLSVGGGGVFLPMYPYSPTFVGLLSAFLKTSFDRRLEVSDPGILPAEAQRSLSLLNAVISAGDPLSFAPLILDRKRNVLLMDALNDELIPNQGSELLARAMGATYVSLPAMSAPLRFVDLPAVSAPYQADSAEGTRAVVQIAPALHTMFTSIGGNRNYQPNFPPFVSLPTPERVENPIEFVHALAIGFMDSLRKEGVGRVESRP